MKEQIIEAVIEMTCTRIATWEECIKYYSPNELIDIWLRYEGITGYSEKIKELYELFYILIPKK